ncbi:MAG: glutamate synthase large subunit [Saprospiraceae bacterium]|nr:glutamate synthase large subunit [Saprospiraceae bacterium]
MKSSSEIEQQKGLYTPKLEKDSCGVGLIADLNGKSDQSIVDSALTMLENMEHRGACGYEANTGDGAGILLQIPHDFFVQEAFRQNIKLPKKGKYGVGFFFLPKDKLLQAYCYSIIEKYALRNDFQIFYRRSVPVDNSDIGTSAKASEPEMIQLFFKTVGFNNKDIERRFYFLRNQILKEIYFSDKGLTDDFYITSFSSKTIVYKGMLTAVQLRSYFPDLTDPHFKSALAIIHSRFSTNTIPKWKLAQPFRCIAHNGEINTIQGNINWWNAREKHMENVSKDRPDLTAIFPVCDPFLSDSGNFDNVVDFLLRASRSIPHTMMMMIPEAWQNNAHIPDYKKAFYEYHDGIIEPWDGPASICFTDGTLVGATLDRNGLRPSRYLLTKDNLLVLGSEAGCLEIEPSKVLKKGRLQPGKMLLADLEEHRIVSDEELKERICQRKPYRKWLNKNSYHIDDLPATNNTSSSQIPLTMQQIAYGIGKEDQQLIIQAMTEKSSEPIGSMGADIPLAIFSKIAQHISNYFKQQFAQVTNPPIDSLREKYYMSLSTVLSHSSRIIGIGSEEASVIRTDHPILDSIAYHKLLNNELEDFEAIEISTAYPTNQDLENSIHGLCTRILEYIRNGKSTICLSDEGISENATFIPSLLIVGALHHLLIEKGLRKEVTIIIKGGDIWETHHIATLLSYGADLIYPHVALKTVASLAHDLKISEKSAEQNYIKAVRKGLLKIMSKLGVSTLASYKGAQTFEALGIHKEVIDVCFKGTISRIGGMTFDQIKKENDVKHRLAFHVNYKSLPDIGNYQWKRKGEYHLFNPKTIHLLQHSTRTNDYDTYKKFASAINSLEENSSTLRSYFQIQKETVPIPLSEVEGVDSILKRFATGAMSFGSISHEAHTTLAKAMNKIGGKSNSGEGGEDESRFILKEDGSWERSAIKQIASGRFGVTSNYLTNATELQIKMAQGAKPGEGGQLPGHKVDQNIARVRHSTPGVGLISPPPHHDIYSIEDLAQLIFDLKNANRSARISVKLVSKAGVGVIASGVAKAHAEHILISGFDGGTGASPLSSIRHAGLPWELGLSETHQTLVKNGLRDRVVLQTDGQIRTGRDLAIATMLGAEEWGIATAALVVEGCILMRKCHLNTCPVGIATQDKTLRKAFEGKVDHLVNYFHFLANELREIMAACGVRTVNELVGRTDFLQVANLDKHWKTEHVNLEPLLWKEKNIYGTQLFSSIPQDHGLEEVLDHKLIASSKLAIDHESTFNSIYPIESTDRAVGAMLSHEISKKYGSLGMLPRSLSYRFKGSAGQSFGAFTTKGIFFQLEGEANDFFGKGQCGSILAVTPDRTSSYDAESNTIIGNVALYGATSGEAYINGLAGDRFAVRNSGVKAVVEGIGDNGCEYMTGGKVVILGSVGQNFAAGMSGGVAYVFDHKVNVEMVIGNEDILLETPSSSEMDEIQTLIRSHTNYTGSKKGFEVLTNWEIEKEHFVKVISKEYKHITEKQVIENIDHQKAS